MKIKKPKWIDDSPHRAGKRLSNIYWGEHPVWKRDEEVLKWSDLDKEMIIYSHTFIYMHRGTELSRESFKTQGSQNIVYHIPTGYVLKDSTFKPKPHGVNRVEIVKESYKLKFKLTHPNIATPIEIVIKKPENVTMTVADARNEIIANPGFPSGYDVDITNFNEFPDELVVNNDFSFNVPLKVGTAVAKPVKKVTIKYYLVDDNGDQTVYKTETGRYLDGNFDYNISIPTGYEQTNRIDNTPTLTSIYIRVKVFNVYIRMATYKNGNINKVWHSYNLTRKYNETVSQADLQPLPDNLKVGTAPNLFKVTLSYQDGFVFNTRTITEDTNIDIPIRASLKMIELLSEVDVPRITEAGIGVYTYGLPTGVIKANSIKDIKVKFVANSIGLENGEKAFAAVFPYNPVKQMIIGNGTELVTGKNINLSLLKSPDFVQKLKTEFSGDLNGKVNIIATNAAYELEYHSFHHRGRRYDLERRVRENYSGHPYIYPDDNFHMNEMNPDKTLKPRWNFKVFDRVFDWTILDTASLSDYTKDSKCWIIISNIVIHPFNEDTRVSYGPLSDVENFIACGLPFNINNIEATNLISVHGTLPTIQIYEYFIEAICPLTIKDYRYYLCDNAKDFISDTVFKIKDIEELMGGATPEGYNRNILANDVEDPYSNSAQIYTSTGGYTNRPQVVHTSIVKDNVLNATKGHYPSQLCMHKAFNWYKYYFYNRDDVLDPALLPLMDKHETSMIIFNYWDVVNHAIGKSLMRTHNKDSRLDAILTELNKDMSIFVNLQILPVCIDVTNDAFPKLTVDMKEKDFGIDVFKDMKTMISFSPVNIKRILPNIPRLTYRRYYHVPYYNMYADERGHEFDVRVDMGQYDDIFTLSTLNRKLYSYRPVIYGVDFGQYNSVRTKSVLGYPSDLTHRVSDTNMYNIRKNFSLNPRILSYYFYDNIINSNYEKPLDKLILDSSNDRLVLQSEIFNGRDDYIDIFDDLIKNLYIKIDPYSELYGRKLKNAYNYYISALNARIKEIIDYNKSITIFDNWKEEVSYDNPQ